MKYRKIPKAKLKVSEISFGCMSLGEDEAQNRAMIHRAFDGGINYFDTADVYQNGWNEEVVGRAIKPFRKDVIVATKVGNQVKTDGSGFNWNPSKSYILEAAEKSLKRLDIECIDLLQLHGGTIEDNREEVVEAFELLKEQGKILHYGMSSIRPNVIKAYAGKYNIATNMLQYSLLDRRPKEEVLDVLADHDIGVMVRGAVAKGLLIKNNGSDYLNYTSQDIDKLRDKVFSFSIEKRLPLHVVLNWILSHQQVTSVVLGMSNMSQLEEALQYSAAPALSVAEITSLSDLLEPNFYQKHRT